LGESQEKWIQVRGDELCEEAEMKLFLHDGDWISSDYDCEQV